MKFVRAKSAALAAAAAGPALLFTAGTAHAAPFPNYASNGPMTIRYSDASFGLTARIWDDSNPAGVAEVCHYVSIGADHSLPFNGEADLLGHGPGTVFIPGHPLGKRWSVTVNCDGTGQSLNFWVDY